MQEIPFAFPLFGLVVAFFGLLQLVWYVAVLVLLLKIWGKVRRLAV